MDAFVRTALAVLVLVMYTCGQQERHRDDCHRRSCFYYCRRSGRFYCCDVSKVYEPEPEPTPMCPETRDYCTITAARKKPKLCESDEDCSGGKLCCYDACAGYVCKNPVYADDGRRGGGRREPRSLDIHSKKPAAVGQSVTLNRPRSTELVTAFELLVADVVSLESLLSSLLARQAFPNIKDTLISVNKQTQGLNGFLGFELHKMRQRLKNERSKLTDEDFIANVLAYLDASQQLIRYSAKQAVKNAKL